MQATAGSRLNVIGYLVFGHYDGATTVGRVTTIGTATATVTVRLGNARGFDHARRIGGTGTAIVDVRTADLVIRCIVPRGGPRR